MVVGSTGHFGFQIQCNEVCVPLGWPRHDEHSGCAFVLRLAPELLLARTAFSLDAQTGGAVLS